MIAATTYTPTATQSTTFNIAHRQYMAFTEAGRFYVKALHTGAVRSFPTRVERETWVAALRQHLEPCKCNVMREYTFGVRNYNRCPKCGKWHRVSTWTVERMFEMQRKVAIRWPKRVRNDFCNANWKTPREVSLNQLRASGILGER